jgi:glycosyltransferase involved in cell wall biosynthesis
MIASGGGSFDALLASHGVGVAKIDHRRRAGSLLKSLVALYRLARSHQVELIHAHMMTSAVLAWPVCKLLRIPLVTTVHNEFQKSSILMGLGTRVIVVSRAVGRSMVKRGIPDSRVKVVLNGTIGAARFARRKNTPCALDHPAIVFVGGIHPRKGLPDLFAAFDLVHAKQPQARLYIVGGGPHLDEYRALVASLPCAAAVTFVGDLDDPYPYLLAADIFVLPSHADPAPLVLSEAREARCAIIATEVDGIPELLLDGKAGILVPPHDSPKLAEQISRLISDPDGRALWRENSQIDIDFLRIERVATQTLAVYADARQACGQQVDQPA